LQDDRVRQFLEIESKTSELLAELEELHAETIKYSTANQALDLAASQIGSLSAAMNSIAEELQAVTISLKDIGMPALLSAQDESKAELQNLHR
jgi:seryl-tRNA synthetase